MATTVDDIRKLRELTGAGMMDCRSALTEAGGDVDKAVTILREKGIAKAAKRAGRETANGVVEAYLAIHIAAAKPRWINPEDVPEDVLDAERQIHAKRFESEGKPAAQIPKIVEGQINAFYKDNCLMKQLWVRDNKTPIENLVKENISRLQENIVVRRFARFDVKEA